MDGDTAVPMGKIFLVPNNIIVKTIILVSHISPDYTIGFCCS